MRSQRIAHRRLLCEDNGVVLSRIVRCFGVLVLLDVRLRCDAYVVLLFLVVCFAYVLGLVLAGCLLVGLDSCCGCAYDFDTYLQG